jgi:catechol 2,3-dioxygenase-like lactoylglutathione lyase family enzyme
MTDPLDASARAELARGRAADPTIKVVDVAYVRFAKPDLDAVKRFGTDFGLLPAGETADALYLRGYGDLPFCYAAERGAASEFLGFGLVAAEGRDLERVAALPGAGPIETLREPGGGQRVRMKAPNGVLVDVVHGQSRVAETPMRPALVINSAEATPRQNAAQRAPSGPAQVKRLGHVVMLTRQHARMLSWLLRSFGLIVSDYQLLPGDAGPAIAFLRCDLGATPADHHSVALAAGFADSFEHAAFEVQDLDAVALGGEHLRRQGWTRAWGIGRHILGSQLFDYWRDPDGMLIEHYADGDRFDADTPTESSPFSRHSLAQWGPPLPKDFIDTSMTPRKAYQLVSALAGNSDFSLKKLVGMAKAMGH